MTKEKRDDVLGTLPTDSSLQLQIQPRPQILYRRFSQL
jgi:hypothetical protein